MADLSVNLVANDGITPAANTAAAAVDGLGSQVGGLSSSLNTAGNATNNLTSDLQDADHAAGNAGDSLSDMGAEGAIGLGAIAGIAAGVATKLLEIGKEAAKAFATFAAESVIGQREAENLFNSITGGQASFQDFQALAESMGVSVTDLTKSFAEFTEIQGISQQEALSLAKAQADLNAAFDEETASRELEKIKKAIEEGKAPSEALAEAAERLGPAYENLGTGSIAAEKSLNTLDGAMNRLKSSVGNALANAFEQNEEKITGLIDAIVELASDGSLQEFIGDAVSAMTTLMSILTEVIGPVVSLSSALFRFTGLGAAWEAIKQGVAAIGSLIDAVGSSPQAVAAAAGKMMQAAADFVNGFIEGIEAKLGEVVAAVADMGSNALGALKGALGIASPSKEAIAIAENVTGSFNTAVEREGLTIPAPELPDGASAGASVAGMLPMASGTTITIEAINVTAPEGVSPEALAALIRTEVQSLADGQFEAGAV